MKWLRWLLLFLPLTVFAGGGHHHHNHDYKIYSVIEQYSGSALAMAMAQGSIDTGTLKWQLSAGVAQFDDNEAFMIGIGKKFCGDCGVLSISAGREEGHTGVAAGYSFKLP
jgi:hypothetical protein